MKLAERQRQLDRLLPVFRDLWHPQPFRESRPAWCEQWPALTAELLALPDDVLARLNDDDAAARAWLGRHLPPLAELGALAAVPERPRSALAALDARWAWEIPGRKRQQIEAFAAAAAPHGTAVVDWCGGKGHLGRLLARQWQVAVATLEIDPQLCAAGHLLAQRSGASQEFTCRDALTAGDALAAGRHAVALHACGDLHRSLLRQGAAAGIARFDVAPCCYHRGVGDDYQPLTEGLQTRLSRDDTRLAVTETVTASPRLTRQRDLEMAWKLGFDAWRRAEAGLIGYRSFKPVPAAWFRGDFAAFVGRLAEREGHPLGMRRGLAEFECIGWQRQRELMRLSVVRHVFRRPLEIWLALDLAVYLENRGYAVDLGSFCARRLTPRNLLISARRAS